MSRFLPEKINPRLLARAETLLEGELPLAGLTRLREVTSGGRVRVRLAFQQRQGRLTVLGSFVFEAQLVCQTCLAGFASSLAGEVRMLLLEDRDSFARLAGEADVFLLDKPLLRPADLLEDDLLLSLPMVPRCRGADCGAQLEYPARRERALPFAGLKDLLEEQKTA